MSQSHTAPRAFDDTHHSISMKTTFSHLRALALLGGLWTFTIPHALSQTAVTLPYIANFNPDKGFKPSQRNFEMIWLQLAGSLEHFGSPEPYLRHMMKEFERVDAASVKATGKAGTNRPPFFTDEYIEREIKNWNTIAPTLALEGFSKNSGRNIRYAMMGSWSMSVTEMASLEKKLTPEEADAYKKLLAKPSFAKSDFSALDSFYGKPYEKLSDFGREQLSKRVFRGTMDPVKREAYIQSDKNGTIILPLLQDHQKQSLAALEDSKAPKANADTFRLVLISRLRLNEDDIDLSGMSGEERDAIFYAHAIKGALKSRFAQIRKQASTEQSDEVEKVVASMLDTLLLAAQSEYETGLQEDFIKRKN